MDVTKDWIEFIELLNSKKVEYVMIGAFAVAFHGHRRSTGDIDFYVRRSEENASRILDALKDFGFGSLNITSADLMAPYKVLQLGSEPGRIDISTGISGVTFEEAWESKVLGEIEGMPVYFLSLKDLVKNKLATGRPEDERDVIKLRKLHGDV